MAVPTCGCGVRHGASGRALVVAPRRRPPTFRRLAVTGTVGCWRRHTPSMHVEPHRCSLTSTPHQFSLHRRTHGDHNILYITCICCTARTMYGVQHALLAPLLVPRSAADLNLSYDIDQLIYQSTINRCTPD